MARKTIASLELELKELKEQLQPFRDLQRIAVIEPEDCELTVCCNAGEKQIATPKDVYWLCDDCFRNLDCFLEDFGINLG